MICRACNKFEAGADRYCPLCEELMFDAKIEAYENKQRRKEEDDDG